MSMFIPSELYTAAQSRAVDQSAIEAHGLPGTLLMARAARAAFELLLTVQPNLTQLQVLCGSGNNGGDGLLVAILACARGIDTRVLLVDGEPRSTDAMKALAQARQCGVSIESFSPGAIAAKGVVVDGMLGTGIQGVVREAYRLAIVELNALDLPVFALDLPSGIDCDAATVAGVAVRARWTISFITAKRGLFTGAGAEHAGERFADDLDVPADAYAAAGVACKVLQLDCELRALPRRSVTSHKGSFGRCLLVGGDRGMGGAIVLAAEAALRTGAGLVQVATRAENVAPLLARVPECLARGVDHRNALLPLLAEADAIVLGPGLGQEAWGEQMLHACFAAGKPLLLDADALNLIAASKSTALPSQTVITPHPGEAGRLLKCPGSDVQGNRFVAAQRLAEAYAATVVLKGNGSLVQTPSELCVCLAGNPGMASGGMGDVLSGVIGALLAQGMAPPAAARLGTLLHSHAGDVAAREIGQAALLASDLIVPLARLLR